MLGSCSIQVIDSLQETCFKLSKMSKLRKFFNSKTKVPTLALISIFWICGAIAFNSSRLASGAVSHTSSSSVGRYRLQEASQFYQRTCRECHGDSANQPFYQRLSESEMVQTILKGRMMDKPPDMPAFEEKGVTPEQARELALFMQELRKQSTKN
jgi:Cytochrome C oxidase, cbb3-type, subunit III